MAWIASWAVVIRALVYRFGIDLREALTSLSHARTWLLEWEVVPGNMVCSEAYHVLNALGASSTAQTLGGKHGIILVSLTLKRVEQIVEVFHVLLKQSMILIVLVAVSEPIDEVVNHSI